MSYETVDNMPVSELFDMVLLTDKFNHPQDYEPAENVFRMFMQAVILLWLPFIYIQVYLYIGEDIYG